MVSVWSLWCIIWEQIVNSFFLRSQGSIFIIDLISTIIVDIPTPPTLDIAAFRRITPTTIEIKIPISHSEIVR